MTAITPGTGGTLTSATAEGAAIEALSLLQSYEADTTTANPNKVNYVSGSFNTDTNLFTGTYQFPAAQTLSAGGSLQIDAPEYLTGVTYTAGTGGTFTSSNLTAAALTALMYLQAKERIPANNPSNLNYIQGTFNSDNGLYSGSFSIPFSLALAAGGSVQITAVEYLT